MLFGTLATIRSLDAVSLRFPTEKMAYYVRLIDNPIDKSHSTLFHAEILCRHDSTETQSYSPHPTILLYIHRDSTSRALRMNDELLIYAQPKKAAGKTIFSSYSYRDYLYRNGVSASCYVDSLSWRLEGHRNELTTRQKAMVCRQGLMDYYSRLGFRGDNLAILSALTLGYRATLDIELQEAYSVAGVSHALAISGMHIGFLCALLLLLMRIVPWRTTTVRVVKSLFAIAILWGYVFLIGMPISAIRAATMFSIYLMIMEYGENEKPSLNVLMLTAITMLILRPLWLFDTGFQLSFVSVASILILHPILSGLWHPKSRPVHYLWQMLCLTIAAQLGTAPLTMLYFYRLPTYFLAANPIVVTLITVIVYGVMLMMTLFAAPFLQQYVATVINALLTLLNGFVRSIGSLPHSAIDGICIRPHEVLLLYAILTAATMLLVKRNARRVLTLLVLIAIFFASRLEFIVSNRPQDAILLYNRYGTPIVHCTARSGESWAVVPDSTTYLHPQIFTYFCSRRRLHIPKIVKQEYTDKQLTISQQIVSYKGHRIALITDNRWRNCATTKPISVDCIYISNGFTSSIAQPLRLFSTHHVVLSSALPERRRRQLQEECRKRGTECSIISEEGCVPIML
jgi:competence protein ComEC